MTTITAFERFRLDRQTYEIHAGKCYRLLKDGETFPSQYFVREVTDLDMPYEWDGPKTFLADAVVGRDSSEQYQFAVLCPGPRRDQTTNATPPAPHEDR